MLLFNLSPYIMSRMRRHLVARFARSYIDTDVCKCLIKVPFSYFLNVIKKNHYVSLMFCVVSVIDVF